MNLRQLRENKNLTQEQLAELIKKDRSLISKLENENNIFPSVDTAKQIARVLEFDWTIFFENVGESSSHQNVID